MMHHRLTLHTFRSSAAAPADLRAFYRRLHLRATQTHSVFISLSPLPDILARLDELHASDPERQLPLHAVPFAVKDNIDARPLATTAACPAYAYHPEHTAFVVDQLEDAGAIVVGKTNMDQFACGLTGMRSPYGTPVNACNSNYIPGGSSSGSAVAVAMGLCVFALGTDTAGSGRVPAAMNHLVGLKPTKGLLSTSGVVPAAASQDSVSIFANTVEDAALVLSIAAKYDAHNPFSRKPPAAKLPKPPAAIERMQHVNFTFGVPPDSALDFHGDHIAQRSYAAALHKLEMLGGQRVHIDFAPFKHVADMLYGELLPERYAAVGHFLEQHAGMEAAALNPDVFLIIMGGKSGDAHKIFLAQEKVRTYVKRAERDTWAKVHFLVVPSVPCALTTLQVANDSIGLNKVLGTYTNFVNLMDLCAVALPAAKLEEANNAEPRGVTIIAQAFEENNLVQLARHFQNTVVDEDGFTYES